MEKMLVEKNSNNKKEIIFFIIFTFAITFTTNGISYFLDHRIMTTFIGLQMLYPALGAMVTNIVFNKEKISKSSLKFSLFYIIFTVCLLAIYCVLGIVGVDVIFLGSIEMVAISILSIVILIISLKKPTDMFETLALGKNIKYVFIFGGIFIITKLIPLIPSVVSGEFKLSTLCIVLAMGPINIILTSVLFFGEEYGWRYYLQDKLMFLLGKKKGVILLGVIWGLWHTPICFMFYTPNQPILGLVEQIIFCIFLGIFFSYSIIKSKSIWPCIVMHWLNNNLVGAATNGSFTRESSIESLLIMTAIIAILYGPFIFTKEFKDDNRIIEIDNTKTIE